MMLQKITPLIKGLITGLAIIATSLFFIYVDKPTDARLQYISYILYAGGIAWTLIAYYRSSAYTSQFGSIFGQGFRCFIIITLITVTFTGFYIGMNPQIAENPVNQYTTDLKKDKHKDKQDREIDEMGANAKKHFLTANISQAIFGSLFTGAIFTAAGAGILLMRRK